MDDGQNVNAFKELSAEAKRGLTHEGLQGVDVESYLALGFTAKAAGAVDSADAGEQTTTPCSCL